MPRTASQQQPATDADKRIANDRREKTDRRQSTHVFAGADQRGNNGDRRSWVGRRQAAEWRHR